MKHILFQLNKIFFCLVLVLFFISNVLASDSSGLMQIVSHEDSELLILEVRVNRFIVSDAIDVYKTNRGTFVPIAQLLESLDFFVEEDIVNGVVSGWIFSQNQPFKIDLKLKSAEFNDKTYVLNSNLVQRLEYGIYLELDFLKKMFFFLDVNINPYSLMITVKSDRPLPVEIQKERSTARGKIKKRSFFGLRRRQKKEDIYKSNALFTIPSINFYTSYRYRDSFAGNKSAYNTSERYSISMSGLVGGFDTDFSMSASSFDELDAARITLSKYTPYRDMFGFASKVELGDISLQAEPLILKGSYGAGMSLSTFRQDYQSKPNDIQISGQLQQGWEVELFRNGVLLDVITEPEEGQYRFEDVSTFVGLNVFTLKFYGPHGQIKEEEKRVFIDTKIKEKGSFDLKFSVVNKKQPFLKEFIGAQSNYNPDVTQYILDTEYGISSLFTLTGGLIYTSPLDDPKEERTQYARAGFKTSLLGMLFNYNTAVNDKDNGIASGVYVETKAFDWRISGEYKHFRGFISEQSEFYGRDLNNYSMLLLDKPNQVFPFKRFPINFSIKKAVTNDDNDTFLERSLRISHNLFKKYRLTLNYKNKNDFSNNKIEEGYFLFSSRYDKISFKGNLLYNISPDSQLTSSNLSADMRVARDFRLSARWNKIFLESNKVDIYTFGISKDLKYGTVGFDTEYDSHKNYGIYLSYSVDLEYDHERGAYYPTRRRYSDAGIIIAKVFIDKNNDDTFNGNDVLLENVKFRSDQAVFKTETDKKGRVVLKGIPAGREANIWVDIESLEDVYWVSKKRYVTALVREGDVLKIDFPILETAEVEGVLKLENKPLRNVLVLLKDKDDKIIKRVRTERDGYFIFDQIPINEYTLTLLETTLADYVFRRTRSRQIEVKIDPEDPIAMLEDVVLEPIKLDHFKEFQETRVVTDEVDKGIDLKPDDQVVEATTTIKPQLELEEELVVNKVKEEKVVLNKNAMTEAIGDLTEGKFAYFKGKQSLLTSRKNAEYANILNLSLDEFTGKNTILIIKEGDKYLVAISRVDSERITKVRDFEITQEQYIKILSTYNSDEKKGTIGCASLVKGIASYFGVNPKFVNPQIKETPNKISENLESGVYDTEKEQFREVSYDEAQEYAAKGGFAVIAYKADKGSGYLAIVVGGYHKDKKSVNNVKIFQSGSVNPRTKKNRFGETTVGYAFSSDIIDTLRFYVWDNKTSAK